MTHMFELSLSQKAFRETVKKNKKSLKDLKKSNMKKSERGKMAEIFVLNHEMEKLKD